MTPNAMPAPTFWAIVRDTLVAIALWVIGVVLLGTAVGVVVSALKEHDRSDAIEAE